MKLAWLTDIHLDHVEASQTDAFIRRVAEMGADIVLLSGDLGEAPSVIGYLKKFDEILDIPVCFVLGNHDFYKGSITAVRNSVRRLVWTRPGLTYLTDAEPIQLTEKTALVGHDGWSDGRYGDYAASDIMLNDYLLINEFKGLNKSTRLELMQWLAEETVTHFARVIPFAFELADRLLLLMHPPPYREVCLYRGQIGDDVHVPHFSCKAVGDLLRKLMAKYPDKHLTVLAGHTHGGGKCKILPNLEVRIGMAEYGHPAVEEFIEIE